MKAIQTRFNGDRFRSRLEARWAKFLYELGWDYRYEPEGFVLDNNRCYLPDFFLPQLNTWLEVKPEVATDEEIETLRLFSIGMPDSVVMLANGNPSMRLYRCFCNGGETASANLTSYIRIKGWNTVCCMEHHEDFDIEAMETANTFRFEFNNK